MDKDKLQRIQAHAREIAALLYEETSPDQLTTLEGIETTVRGHILNHVSPEIGVFLSQQAAAQAAVEPDRSKVSSEKSPSVKAKRKDSKSKAAPN
jgi:GH24 family phage-related lysozyme (muramidase)